MTAATRLNIAFAKEMADNWDDILEKVKFLQDEVTRADAAVSNAQQVLNQNQK